MKKIIFVLLLCAGIILPSQGQYYKNAAGFRIGDGSGIFYKTFRSEQIAQEYMMSFKNGGIQGVVLFEKYLPTKISQNFFFYYGGGGFAGFEKFYPHRHYYSFDHDNYPYHYQRYGQTAFSLGAMGIVGIEYRFNAPITVGLDVKPRIALIGMRSVQFDVFDFSLTMAFLL